jgi:hypothetical protein
MLSRSRKMSAGTRTEAINRRAPLVAAAAAAMLVAAMAVNAGAQTCTGHFDKQGRCLVDQNHCGDNAAPHAETKGNACGCRCIANPPAPPPSPTNSGKKG